MNRIAVSVEREGRPIGDWLFPAERLTLGRGRQADVPLVAPEISRLHAVLEVREGSLVIRDTGSKHGFRVNGQQTLLARISRADQIDIWPFVVRCQLVSLVDDDFAIPDPALVPQPVSSIPEPPVAPTGDGGEPNALGDPDPDADLDAEPGFELADVLREVCETGVDDNPVLEVITLLHGNVRDVRRWGEGAQIEWDPDGQCAFEAVMADGRARLLAHPGSEVLVYGGQEPRRLLPGDEAVTLMLQLGGVVEVRCGAHAWILRVVPPVGRLPDDVDVGAVVSQTTYSSVLGVLSIVGHALLFLLVVPLLALLLALIPGAEQAAIEEADRFVELRLDVPPTPTPTPEKKAKKAKPTPSRKQKKAVARKAHAPKPRQKVQTSKQAAAGITGAMGKLDVRFNSRAPVLAAATNLKAVRVPGGGGYKVSGIAVKGKGVINGRPGGAFGSQDVGTRGQVLNALGGAGGLKRRGSKKVRGQVAAPPKRAVGVQGHLSKAEIAAVVNKHIREIRHCYEKALLRDSGLSGKVLMEWNIQPNGRVSTVRVKFSSLRGGSVTGCMASRIRTWTFPEPKGGGHVIVTYPFLFESVGF